MRTKIKFFRTPFFFFTLVLFYTIAADAQSLFFTKEPSLVRIEPTSLAISWETNLPAKAHVFVGKTSRYERGAVEVSTEQAFQQVTLDHLWPGTVYHVRITAFAGSEQVSTGDWLVITASHSESTGQMAVYFTKSVDTTLAMYKPARGNEEPYRALVARIDQAKYSIDFCAYSLNLTEISDALIAAKNRGVAIRFIYDNGHHQSAVDQLRNAGITVIDDSFGKLNDGHGLQHNKFVVIDARDTTSFSDDWLWTGSYNFTWQATQDNAENAVLIQDESLAKIYTMEFNEMWGSPTNTPNADSARFSQQKTDNTPHATNVNGIRVEAYFSPGDGVQDKIERAIGTASDNIEFAILSFTRWGIRDALIDRFNSGVAVHGLFDRGEQGNSYSQFNNLKNAGLDVLYYGGSGMLHHKYMIVDGHTNSDPLVETGSYNYSSSAEKYNNENILIIHSPLIADFYWQEFAARYHKSGGKAPLTTKVVEQNPPTRPLSFLLGEPFPNPARLIESSAIEFWFQQPAESAGTPSFSIFNILGQPVYKFKGDFSVPGLYRVIWDKKNFAGRPVAPGIYFLQAAEAGRTITKKVVIIQ